MNSLKTINQEYTEVDSLRVLTEVYGELAATRMIKVRERVLKNRDYLESIESIFIDTLAAYRQKVTQMIKAGKRKEGEKMTFLSHNGRSVSVFLSANTGFYGQVLYNIFKKFIEDVRKSDVEVTIVGKVGKKMFLDAEPNRPYTYFDLPDFGDSKEKLGEALKHLVQYEEIKLYFGKYVSIIRQDPEVTQIVAGTPVTEEIKGTHEQFIFEPSLEKVLMFFEGQVFGALFEQSLKESQLAKLASRMLAMQEAQENIKRKVVQIKSERTRIYHRISQKKQLNNFQSVLMNIR